MCNVLHLIILAQITLFAAELNQAVRSYYRERWDRAERTLKKLARHSMSKS